MNNQGTQQWRDDRAGYATASRFKDVVATSKRTGEPLKARQDYMMEIVTERLTGVPIINSIGRAGEWGKDVVAQARAAYEAITGKLVKECGFIKHPKIKMVGCSPDGLIDKKGGLEIKCPINSSIHLQTVLSGMPDEHTLQIQGNLSVTGRSWWDFVSFDPRMPEHLKIHIQRIKRNNRLIINLEKSIKAFLRETNKFIKSLPVGTK